MPKIFWRSFCRLTTQRSKRTVELGIPDNRIISRYCRADKKSLLARSLITRMGWFNVAVSRIKRMHSLNWVLLNRCCTRSLQPLIGQRRHHDDSLLCSKWQFTVDTLVKTRPYQTRQKRALTSLHHRTMMDGRMVDNSQRTCGSEGFIDTLIMAYACQNFFFFGGFFFSAGIMAHFVMR